MGSSQESQQNPPLQNRTCTFQHIRLPLTPSHSELLWLNFFFPDIWGQFHALSWFFGPFSIVAYLRKLTAGLRRVRAGESTCNIPITLFTNNWPYLGPCTFTYLVSDFISNPYIPSHVALTFSSRLIAGDHYLALDRLWVRSPRLERTPGS